MRKAPINISALCILLLSISQVTFAQEKKKIVITNDFHFSIGVNVSDPIINSIRKQALDSFDISSPNIYANLGYKKWHLRAGFGGRTVTQNNRSDLANNVSEIQDYKYALTGSLLRRSDISEKFSIYAGVYFWNLYYLQQTSFDSGFDLTTKYHENIGYAGGPGVMLEYHIGKKISVFTEYCALYRIDFRYEGRTFSAFPNESYKKHSSTINSINFQHPISFFINYKF